MPAVRQPARVPWTSKPAKPFFGTCEGETIFVVGYGPSLYEFDWSKLEGKKVIGLNNTIRKFVGSFWFFSDGTIWKHNTETRVPEDLPIVIPHSMRHIGFPWPEQAYGVQYISGGSWDAKADTVYMRGTVATAATCFAYRLGAKKIVLLGVDCYAPAEGPYYADGSRLAPHQYKGARPVEPGVLMEKRHHEWLEAFGVVDQGLRDAGAYDRGLEIFNASEKSRLEVFPKRSLAELLEA